MMKGVVYINKTFGYVSNHPKKDCERYFSESFLESLLDGYGVALPEDWDRQWRPAVRRARILTIKKAVCGIWGVSLDGLTSRGRDRTLADARCAAGIYLLSQGYTTIASARALKRDHSSIVQYRRKHTALMETDREYRRKYNELEKRLGHDDKETVE